MASLSDFHIPADFLSPVSKRSMKSLKVLSLPTLQPKSLDRSSLKPTSLMTPSPRHQGTHSLRGEGASLYPYWLETRKDFQELRGRYDKLASIDVYEVCKQPALLRNDFERRAVVRFIKQCPFFSSMKTDQLMDLTDKMQAVYFHAGQVLMARGEQADCLYTIYQGKTRVYLYSDVFIDEIAPGNVVGESAIQSRGTRSATVIAYEDVKALRLTAEDFDTVAYRLKLQDFYDVADFLSTLDYFEGWNRGKLYRLASIMIVKQYNQGQVVYRRGDSPRDVYVVREGIIQLKIDFDLEHKNRWPIGKRKWQSVSTIKRYQQTLKECHPGDFFGERELIECRPLRATAQCVSPTALLLIIRQEFFSEIFSNKDRDGLYQRTDSRPLTKDLRLQMEFERVQAKAKAAAFLNAIDTNCMPGGRDIFQSKRDLRRGELAKRIVDNLRADQKKGVVGQMKRVEILAESPR